MIIFLMQIKAKFAIFNNHFLCPDSYTSFKRNSLLDNFGNHHIRDHTLNTNLGKICDFPYRICPIKRALRGGNDRVCVY